VHYYKRNIGDYAKKAGRLSILQHGVYNLLIDACYDRERFPTRDEAVDWVWASSAAEEEAVDFVLRKFFTLEDGVYVQQHIKEDLAEYLQKAENNKRIANEREANRKAQSTERARTVHEAPPNHKPLTTNQEPKRQGASVAGEQGGPVGPARAGFENLGSGSGPGSDAAAVMAAAGLADVSATHPKLLALLAAGMTVAELQAAAVYAVGKGVGFAYALSRAEGQRRDAAALAALPDAPTAAALDPDSVDAVQAEAARLGMSRWEKSNLDARGVHEPWPVFKARVRKAQAAESEVLA
jgi:uncharacterized protein YdaU (DUF1376 family)